MKPKLIILNGPLGSGKTTLARKYIDSHAMTLNVEVDDIKRSMGDYRSNNKLAQQLAREVCFSMIQTHLKSGKDVIFPHGITNSELFERIDIIVDATGSRLIETLIDPSFEEVLKRYIERGQSQGFADGFDPQSNIAQSGREQKLRELYDRIMSIACARPKTLRIDTFGKSIDVSMAALENITRR